MSKIESVDITKATKKLLNLTLLSDSFIPKNLILVKRPEFMKYI